MTLTEYNFETAVEVSKGLTIIGAKIAVIIGIDDKDHYHIFLGNDHTPTDGQGNVDPEKFGSNLLEILEKAALSTREASEELKKRKNN